MIAACLIAIRPQLTFRPYGPTSRMQNKKPVPHWHGPVAETDGNRTTDRLVGPASEMLVCQSANVNTIAWLTGDACARASAWIGSRR